MPALVKSKTLSCATMFSADQRDKKLTTVNQVVLKASDTYENAIKNLKFENDKTILTDARQFLLDNNYITEV